MPLVQLIVERESASAALCELAERVCVERGEISDRYRKGVTGGSHVHAFMAEIFGVNRTSYYRRSVGHKEGSNAKEATIRAMQEIWKSKGYPEIDIQIPSGGPAQASCRLMVQTLGRQASQPDDAPDGALGTQVLIGRWTDEDVAKWCGEVGNIPFRAFLRTQWLDFAVHPEVTEEAKAVILAIPGVVIEAPAVEA